MHDNTNQTLHGEVERRRMRKGEDSHGKGVKERKDKRNSQ